MEFRILWFARRTYLPQTKVSGIDHEEFFSILNCLGHDEGPCERLLCWFQWPLSLIGSHRAATSPRIEKAEDSANEHRRPCLKSIDVFPKRSTMVLSCYQNEEVHIGNRPQPRIPQEPMPGIRAEVGNQWETRTPKLRSDTRK